MTHLFRTLALLASSFAAATAFAAAPPIDAGRTARVAEEQAARAGLLRRPAAAAPASTTAGDESVDSQYAGLPQANVLRTYPPSCLADPLPDEPSGLLFEKQVTLYQIRMGQSASTENVVIRIWRVACSSDTTFNSATLMRIQRATANEGRRDMYPLFPAIRVAQNNSVNNVSFDNPKSLIRVVTEPNTVIADSLIDSPVINSTTYVLENYPYTGAGYFDFNLPFSIRFDNLINSGGITRYFTTDVSLYNPTQQLYPDAFRSLPITGYQTAAYFDPAHGGEGMYVDIFEVPASGSQPRRMVLQWAWFTFDHLGLPFWINGNVDFQPGARSVTSPAIWVEGGRFAGGAGFNAQSKPWGSVTFEFPSCGTFVFDYASNNNLPEGVPSGSGEREWIRLADVNGLTCE
ncbi:hypothetical protein [Dokdonella koreensis]|uniref:Secreted protein n=1 Tax=Dokdonella koreensis DS-123 TaxID=1300342 RepID=A0A167G5R0_9GAMM|nr:hypothetical protein [Dokdonella koreensis]ANB16182.1 Hypothetical protein I596_142 [Dokdonella koreensis DS-123]